MKSISKLTITLSVIALLVGLCNVMDVSGRRPGQGAIRHLRRAEEVLGGYQPVTNFESDEEVTAAASFAFEDLQSPASNYTLSSDVASYEVVGASTQVVAGVNIKLDMVFLDSSGNCVETATVVVYDRFGDMSVTSFEPNETGCPSTVTGGYQAVPSPDSDEEVTAAASFAFEQLQSPGSNYTMPSGVASYEVVRASTQVVAGINIKMDMVFLDSAGDCVGAAEVVVYDQFGTMSITSYEPSATGCEGVDTTTTEDSNVAVTEDSGTEDESQLLGGYKPAIDFESDEEVTAAASFAFEDLQSPDSNYTLSSDVASYEILGASTQVVAGTNIKLDMAFLDSSGNCVGGAIVVVYDQFGDMSITSYEPNDTFCEGVDTTAAVTEDSDTADISSAYFKPKGSVVSLMAMVPLTLMLQY